jgi:methionyl-tRNA formyltransferase
MNIAICTHGSIGVITLYKLFELKFKPNEIIVITHDIQLPRNRALINFLDYFVVKWFVVGEDMTKLSEILLENKIELLVNIAYKFIFRQPIFDIRDITFINLHPGILPDYRGWFSIPWAIFNNEKCVGYTYHLITPEIDGGDIVYAERFLVHPLSTAFSLHFPIMREAIDRLKEIIEGKWIAYSQPEGGKYYKRILPNNGYINTSWDDAKIDRFIRAMYFPPFKGALLNTTKGEKEILSFKQYLLEKE